MQEKNAEVGKRGEVCQLWTGWGTVHRVTGGSSCDWRDGCPETHTGRDLGVLVSPGIGSSGPCDGGGGAGVGGEKDRKAERGGAGGDLSLQEWRGEVCVC